MKIRVVPNLIIGTPRSGATVTPGGVIKPQSAVEKEQPGITVDFIHPDTSKELGIMVGDPILYHGVGGISHDVEQNGRVYCVVHKDNVIGVIEQDDGEVVSLAH
jgi:co-chaperonin GroES (HSP10)